MKHIKRLVVVLIITLGVFLYFFTFKLTKTQAVTNENLIEYSKEGFVSAKTLTNTSKLVGENDQLKLYLDETTSYFWVEDKITGEVIRSNPNVRDPRENLVVNDDLADMNEQTVIKAYNHIQYKFTLPTTGTKGSLITWSSSDESIITSNFEVISPAEDTVVLLTATLTADDETSSIVYQVTVRTTGAILVTVDSKNPAEFISRGLITSEAKDKQKSTLEFSYYNKSGSIISLNNYNLSIYHPESILEKEGNRTYEIKYLKDKIGFQVHYTIANQEIDYLYFPKYMTEEMYDTLPNTSSTRFVKGIMNWDNALQLYFIRNYENLTFLAKRELYDVYYNVLKQQGLEYSREKAIEENAEHGYFETTDAVKFEIGVEVALTEKGFKTSIIKNSIVEPENLKLANISLYPLLGTAISIHEDKTPTKGYMVVPDGSGAVINFNNSKEDQKAYRKRIYGPDITNQMIKMPEEQEYINIPLYGMVKENVGLASVVTEGASMTYIYADISERIDSYNKIYPIFQLRENYLYTLGSGFNTYSVSLWSQGMVDTDLVVEHTVLRGDQNNYNGIAKVYQNYLVKEKQLVKQVIPTLPKTTIEILGAYDVREYMLGFPYNKVKSLTTFKEAQQIADEFIDEGYDINIVYNGALNGGLRNSIQTKVSFVDALGGKKGYTRLDKHLAESNTEMFLQVNVAQVKGFRRAFDEYSYAAQRLDGSLSRDFEFHIPSMLPYSETPYIHSADDYIINPRYYEAIYNKLDKKLPTDNISFTRLGSNLVGSYRSDDTVYTEDTLRYTTNLLEGLDKNILLRNPYGFALPYTSYATDIPMDTTLYSIIDYSIPLYQLVLADYVPYSSRSLNMQTQRSEKHNFLRILETGSQLKYTLTFVNPKELLNTEYSQYLSTYYLHWMDVIKEESSILEELNLYGGHLVEHEFLRTNVFRVKYSHGLELYINYNQTPVVVNGVSIDALSYTKGGL